MDGNQIDDKTHVPRLYQTQLEEIAFSKNTLIHLPTGSGKTFIAIQLIKRFKDAYQKPWGEGGKRCFFLVNTVPLVNQQRKVIEYRCPVNGVGGYSGEDGVDYWNKVKWDNELAKYEVIVMTTQILSDMLTHNYIRIEDIKLLIFDECHHAVEDHPMRSVMKHFEMCPRHKQPRVLGLTATLLNSNVKFNKIEETLRMLENTFQATIATVNEMGEVLSYSTNPKETIHTYVAEPPSAATLEAFSVLTDLQSLIMSVNLPQVQKTTQIQLKPGQIDITKDPLKIVKAVKNMITSMMNITREMGPFGGTLSVLAYVILLERLKRKAQSKEEELLYSFTITHCVHARMILEDSMKGYSGYEKIVRFSSDKILKMLNILKEYNPDIYNETGAQMKVNLQKKPLSAIIFTQERFTCKVLYNLLKYVRETNPEQFGFLKHDFIVGFNVNPFNNTREQHYVKKLSSEALLKFKNSDLNCLISTSVIEEGIDVPQCLLVMRYDEPKDYRSYIQSKGRARCSDSNYIILSDAANRQKFESRYSEFKCIEKYISKLLCGNTLERDAPTEEDVQKGLYEEEIPPYCSEHGVRLSAVSAISLLNRYCTMLPHDQFTSISPMWIQEKVDGTLGLRRTIIILPVECPVKKPIKGEAYAALKMAKRSAALNACIQLHQAGELDEVTLLPRQYGKVDFDEIEVKQCFPNWPWDGPEENDDLPKVGTKHRVRKYEKLYPDVLDGPGNWESGERIFYLHVIKLKIAYQEPKDSREMAIYKLLKSDQGYGLLTFSPLPALCEFPIFLTAGEVTTSIKVNYAKLPLNLDAFELIKRFHFFIFDEVLEMAKKFLVFDGKNYCLYVVPIRGDADIDIDWDLLQTYKPIPPVATPSDLERQSLRVTTEEYKYAVVTPYYRSSVLPDRYIVSNVLEYMTPQSPFGAGPYTSFEEYYNNKYNLEILGRKDQPMLEVRSITTRGNCLLPRAATIKTLTDKQKKLIAEAQGDKRFAGFPEMLVPEFCIKFDYPGVMWLKAIMLPSIIHRVTMLLVADQLRVQIQKFTGKAQHIHLPDDKTWQPIGVDIGVAVKSMLADVEEPTTCMSVDRINNPIDDSAPRPPRILSMRESVYQLQKKKLSKEYPWLEENEPIDVERNLMRVTVMDVECYDTFVSAPLFSIPNADNPTHIQAPVVEIAPKSGALLPPPPKYNDKINLLSQQSTTYGPELRDLLAAITTINSHDNFDLERAETLGDSFLKFAASCYLYHKFPNMNEGQLTNIKCRLIGNRNLFYAGDRIRLPERMKVEQFTPSRDLVVPGFFAPEYLRFLIGMEQIRPTFLIGVQFSLEEALSGVLNDATAAELQDRIAAEDIPTENEKVANAQNAMQCYVIAQAVSDKSVADCVEALLGTYLVSGGMRDAVSLLEWLRVLPPQDNFINYLSKRVETVITRGEATVEDIERLLDYGRAEVETILGYKFKDPALLLEALSHASYIRNRYTRSYERLEFLGDAILDFLITSYIYENSKDLKPGELTDLRSALVNNVTFASYVVKLGLHKHLCNQLNPALENSIMNFVEHQQQRDHEIIEDVLYLIAEADCNICEYIEVPKVLSDLFESLTGAMYLDCGGDLGMVWRVIYRIMHKEIESFSACIPKQPVRVLHENIHACAHFGDPKLSNAEIPKVMVPVTFSKTGRQHTVYGVGNNKSQAKRAAAKLALKFLA